jgi:outer membrane protein OmpA-like peptidoglycan-associated protein
MKNVINLALVLFASLSLIGCSYFNPDEDLDVAATPPVAEETQAVDVTQNPGDEMPMSDMPSFEAQSVPAGDLTQAVSHATDGSVQVFPLDDEIPPGPVVPSPSTTVDYNLDSLPVPNAPMSSAPVETGNAISVDTIKTVPPQAPSARITSDPSVQVFPLDAPVPMPITTKSVGPHASLEGVGNSSNYAISNQADGPAIVFFDRSSTKLNSDAKNLIATLTAISGNVSVQGFASTESTITDPVRRKIVNLQVSMSRALSVARALIEKGIPAETITTVAYGEARPAPDPAQSRRVEIYGVSAPANQLY